MNFFQGNKKFILIGIIVLLLAAIPLTVSFLQQEQISNSHAQKATTIYFATPGQITATDTVQKAVGDDIPLDIVLDPGTNIVSFVKLNISYDASKLDATADSFKPNSDVFPSNGILEGPTVANGSITVTLSIVLDVTREITKPTKIATITFKAKDTTGSTPTTVKFIDGQTQVLSVATNEHNETNVLASTKPITIAIGAATTSPTPTPAPTGPTQPPVPNQVPTCTTLNIDRTPTGKAPLSLTFTANGRDSDGTISKVTFNFGDGPVQDITQTGGIGTNTVSTTASHTYNNPGTFQASAILTDNTGAISSGTTCTQTITVTAATTGTGGIGGIPGGTGVPGGASGSGIPTIAQLQPTPTTPIAVAPTLRAAPRPTLPAAGPGDTLIKGGVIAAIVSIAGALMFFAL